MNDDILPRLPEPKPNVDEFRRVLQGGDCGRVPLVELAIAEEVLAALHGRPLIPLSRAEGWQTFRAGVRQRVRLHRALGYDYYRVRAEIPFQMETLPARNTAAAAAADRQWVNEQEGLIKTAADLETYPWPTRAAIDFAAAEAAADGLPEGMGLIGFSGGVLEWSSNLLGLESMMLLLYDEPGLVQAVVDRVGQIIYEAFHVFCQMDGVFAIWLGDDMGFKTATLLQPRHLRQYILPWHQRYAELAHRTGRLFLLHSCGHVEAIMPDLIETVRIDAKHSFEDVIVPVEEFKRRWGTRVAVLGGVDVDLLSRGPEAAIRRRTGQILAACAPGGGYACGSGNSITNYMPAANYVAMLETLHRFNGRL
ncbi:MAG TPA: uroporphyrinogen decarboxylase family protein [Verrucomicrobiota bacterium]|jgi:uroporphyrinogen decarboxylase|nr:uroporphyrinogen-III decarboxylase-like protein [Verrucomicrobiota bacterium]OQC25866.1 MAG: methylcobalamin:coenzyme M methyltransferase [Verrucomicrobia bacterium ADurb.Bin063]HRR65453.1 uroporphyrinogen decarboxylase family protein [Candidatus Paceibacterota bacterium]MBP8014782.1 uroporphyrinogen-III decarboxylase-like protein [Verrucomicrobiota bacterium]MDI9372508.1 uroporphyrinogen decarboxylase family protein [Verrucomicrobiota bacterium]